MTQPLSLSPPRTYSLPDFDAPIDLDQYECETLRELRAIKAEIAAEVAHLPIDEALRELARRDTEAAREAGFTEREEIRIGDKMVTVLKRPKAKDGTNGGEGSHG